MGNDDLRALAVCHGRHTIISHALAGGRPLTEVRDAAGHANVSITSGYLHVAVDEEFEVGRIFLTTDAADVGLVIEGRLRGK